MPNWCFNRWTISGDPDLVEKVRRDLFGDGGAVTFSKLVPEPAPGESELFDSNPNEWRRLFWGTKWDAVDSSFDMDEEVGILELEFLTPWEPPRKVYQHLVSKYPGISVHAFYDEPGLKKAGYL